MLANFLLLFTILMVFAVAPLAYFRWRHERNLLEYFEMPVTPKNAAERRASSSWMNGRVQWYTDACDDILNEYQSCAALSIPANAHGVVTHILNLREISSRLKKANRTLRKVNATYNWVYRERKSGQVPTPGSEVPIPAGAGGMNRA